MFAPILVICALLGSCGDSVLFIPFVCVVVPKPFGFVQNQDSDSELIQNGGDHRKPVTAKLADTKVWRPTRRPVAVTQP